MPHLANLPERLKNTQARGFFLSCTSSSIHALISEIHSIQLKNGSEIFDACHRGGDRRAGALKGGTGVRGAWPGAGPSQSRNQLSLAGATWAAKR